MHVNIMYLPADASQELQALVDGMLRKDPGARFSWAQVTGHAFWLQPLPCLQVPAQPHLEALIAEARSQVCIAAVVSAEHQKSALPTKPCQSLPMSVLIGL